jgi:hypothetical protein
MQLDIKQTLNFFDNKEYSEGHASALIGMIGEYLNFIAFKHYLENKEKDIEVIFLKREDERPIPVTQGKQKGKRLDMWIIEKHKGEPNNLFQCEIKNWSATAIGGKSLILNANNEEIFKVAKHQWDRQLKEFLKPYEKSTISKVLTPMKVPEKYESFKNKVKPLLIFWMPIINPKIEIKPYFETKVSKPFIKFKTPFKTLSIFSVSIYFRELLNKNIEYIEFDCPIIEKRIKSLNNIIKK